MPFNVRDIAVHMKGIMIPLMRKKKVELDFDVSPDIPEVSMGCLLVWHTTLCHCLRCHRCQIAIYLSAGSSGGPAENQADPF